MTRGQWLRECSDMARRRTDLALRQRVEMVHTKKYSKVDLSKHFSALNPPFLKYQAAILREAEANVISSRNRWFQQCN